MKSGSLSFWARRPRLVVGAWLMLAALLVATGSWLGMATIIPGPASQEALSRNPGEQLALSGGLRNKDSLSVVVSHPTLQVQAPEFEALRDTLVEELRRLKNPSGTEQVFERVNTSGHIAMSSFSEVFESADKHSLLIDAETVSTVQDSSDELMGIPNLVASWERRFPQFTFYYVSQGTGDNETFELINRDLDRSLWITIPVSLAILLWAFGSVGAALLPLFMAIVSLLASLGASAVVSRVISPVSATASQLVVLLVLAIGVDYSLFIVSRVREEIRSGKSYPEAIDQARARTGAAVLWSGLTVALSLVGLILMNDTVLTSMAVVSIVAVFITALGVVGVLPSVLLLLGPRLEFLPLRRRKDSDQHSALRRWLKLSIDSPVVVLLFGVVAIAAISSFCLDLKLGSTFEPELLPSSMQSTQAFQRLREQFPDIAGTDFSVVLKSDRLEELEDDGALQPFMNAILLEPRIKGPFKVERSEDRSLARFNFMSLESANSPKSAAFVDKLRAEAIPQMLSSLGVEAYVSGTLPYVVDENRQYLGRTPVVFGAVLCLSVLFLLIAFRSVVVPIKAILLNILSTGASFGVLVLIFQASGFPGWHYGIIEGFVPALLFSILFGLSMDYHVFLISRVSEEVSRGASTRKAVEKGILETSGAITSAALIMVSVFAVVATLELPVMKQLGLGLAVAVLLDATIIRSMLLPASMILLGKWNWYFPRWLRWVPKLQLE